MKINIEVFTTAGVARSLNTISKIQMKFMGPIIRCGIQK